MFLACKFPEDPHLQNKHVNINTGDSSEFTVTTFLFVEPNVSCAVVVCRATHGVVLRRDVLEFLRGCQVQYL